MAQISSDRYFFMIPIFEAVIEPTAEAATTDETSIPVEPPEIIVRNPFNK